MNDLKIDFIGIGAGKSATSWISKCLSEHPEIDFSNVKETNFFIKNNFSKGNNWYSKHFKNNKKKKGEYSPQYLYSPEAPKNIKQHSPDAKIILCLRNPLGIIESAFSFEHHMGRGNTKTPRERFEKYFNQESKDKGLYFSQLQKYLKLFPREQIFISIYEDIEKNPKKFIQEIYKFLDIDSEFIPKALDSRVNVTAPEKLRSKKLHRLINKTRRDVAISKNGFFWMSLIKKLGLNKLANIILKLNKRSDKKLKSSSSNLLTKKERSELLNYYKKDIIELEKLINRKLDFWN